jgi:protein gp37
MGENSKIEWTHHTFNPWVGCQKVSPGCDHCYAEAWSRRYDVTQWGPHGERIRTSKGNWKGPVKWAEGLRRAGGGRLRVFCASLADVWDNQAPAEWRHDLFHLINNTPELDWMLLTKRPENIAKMLQPATWDIPTKWPWPNVWLGTTAEDQAHFDRRWPVLAQIPAAVRFISYEPALGPLRLGDCRPDWIICGGESGPGARYMEPSWAASLRDECSAAGIPFFMKQMTGKTPIPPELLVRQYPRPMK